MLPPVSSGTSTLRQNGEPVIPARAERSSVSRGRPNKASTAFSPSCRQSTPSAARQSGSRRINRCDHRPCWYFSKPESEAAGARVEAPRVLLAAFHNRSVASSSLVRSGLILIRFDKEEMSVLPFSPRLQLFVPRSTHVLRLLFLALSR